MATACLLALTASANSARAQTHTENFVVMANGEKVGQLTAQVSPVKITTDYAISDNGRGPKAKETIDLDAAGRPVHWRIDGASLFGTPLTEHFDWAAGSATWESQADKGSVKAARPPLYVANDGSPWINGLYVKALLAAPNHTMPVLPSGEMHLEAVKTLSLGEGERRVNLTVYELSGIELEPRYVLLDDKGELFGTLGSQLIRSGYEGELKQLAALQQDIALARAHDAQDKLAHRFPGPVQIKNVRVFDPKTMTLSGPSIVGVWKDRITFVEADHGQAAAPGDTVIDGQGGVLLPGLHDMHSHTSLSSNLFNLAAGVTATRDMGNKNAQLLAWLNEMKDGKLAGPRIVPDGFLEGRSPYSARNGFVIDTLPDALKAVRWYADHGYWQVKIYNSMNPDYVKPIADEAHRLGMGVTGHVPAFSNPDRVIREGYDTIAHINQLMLGWLLSPTEDTRTPLRLTGMIRAKDLDLKSAKVRTTVDLMKTHHVSLDTTDMIVERLMLSRSGEVQAGDALYLDHTPIGYQRYRKRSFVTIDSPQTDRDYKAAFEKVLAVTRLLYDEGVQQLPGTDDGTGFSTHRELELYVKAGIPPAQVLRMDTLDCETYFGRAADAGSIERGKFADMILVPSDPTENISAVRQVRMTMANGVVYYPSEIYTRLGVKPFAPPPPVTTVPGISPSS